MTTALALATHPFQMLLLAVSVRYAVAAIIQAYPAPRPVRSQVGIAPRSA